MSISRGSIHAFSWSFWTIADIDLSLSTRVQTQHPKLGEIFSCHLGLKTGANDVFLNPPEYLEPEVLRWALRGRDVIAFGCQPRVRLLWTHDRAGRRVASGP